MSPLSDAGGLPMTSVTLASATPARQTSLLAPVALSKRVELHFSDVVGFVPNSIAPAPASTADAAAASQPVASLTLKAQAAAAADEAAAESAVVVPAGHRQILYGICGSVMPGEVLALMVRMET